MQKQSLLFLTVYMVLLVGCGHRPDKGREYANALIHEKSPYLLQHADDPVNWYPWGKEALTLAEKENKLLVISIGYEKSHWCQVMEKQSFEDISVAKQMNNAFVSIKVDKNELSEIGQKYAKACQTLKKNCSFPMNIIALPNGKPVFTSDYMPKEDWQKTLIHFESEWKNNPEGLIAYSEKMIAAE